ncbi:MAG TPA: aspartate-alanine antiporter [Burkholderiales bacterium]|nr:aspartate-alanine antiporter [Burkholderiales bacterium]
MHYLIHYPFDTIRQYPETAIFLTLAIGFWFGRLKFGSFSLGAVTSTLIAGLLVGQLHVPIAHVVESTFFLMFLFAVGYSVGPQFFRALRKDGLPQVAFALLVCASGLLCAYALGKMLGYNPGLAAGLLSGGYTNSGTLGVATGYFNQLGLSADNAAAMASLSAIAYAVTYPFGTAGAAWFLGSLGPKLLRVDLPASCKELERTMEVRSTEPGVGSAYRAISARAYRVENAGLIGQKARDVAATLGTTDAFVIRVRQDGGIIEADTGTILQNGATVVIAGHPEALLAAGKTVGPEVDDAELLGFPTEQLDIVITKKDLANRTIKELQDAKLARSGRGVFLSKLTRAGSKVDPSPDLQLHRWDVLTLLGARNDIEEAAKFLGYADRATPMSDITFMSVAVVIGALLGAVTIHVGGIPLSLSTSVGVLIAGLVCGYLRSVYRTFGRIPDPALWIFNNVGLNGFIAVVGLNAATGLVAGLKAYGLGLFLAGIVVSMVPLVVGLYAGKYIFKFHPGILLGACAGARTTTAALGAVQEAANSTIPAIGYTIPYAVGRIVLAICGVIIVLLMK